VLLLRKSTGGTKAPPYGVDGGQKHRTPRRGVPTVDRMDPAGTPVLGVRWCGNGTQAVPYEKFSDSIL